MAMSKKHYEAIAEAIKREVEVPGITGERERAIVGLAQLNLARAIALVMREDNPRFDTNRFMKACGF